MAKKWKFRYSILAAFVLNIVLLLFICLLDKNATAPKNEFTLEIEIDISNFTPPEPEIIPALNVSETMGTVTSATNKTAQQSDHEFFEQAMQTSFPNTVSVSDATKPSTSVSDRRNDLDRIAREIQGTGTYNRIKVNIPLARGNLPSGHQIGESFKSRGDTAKRTQLIKRYGGDKQSESAVEKSLKFLASAQNPNGSWGCAESFKTGDALTLSSLSLLAFFAHGERFDSKLYADNIRKGVDFLISISNEPNIEYAGDGFGHAVLTYALAECYAISGSYSLRRPLEERLKIIIERQNKFGSFSPRYDNTPQVLPATEQSSNPLAKEIVAGEPACDLSLFGWHIQAMTASRNAGINIDGIDKALELAKEALIKIHQAEKGGFSQGINMKRFKSTDNMNPVGLLSLQLLGLGSSLPARHAEKAMKDESGKIPLPVWGKSSKFPLYRWYYQTQALFQAEEGRGKEWDNWNENLKAELTSNQQSDGRWNLPVGDNSFRLKDKKDLAIYSSSLCALMLQVYYRYLPSYSIIESASINKKSADDLDMGMAGLITRLPGGADPMASVFLDIHTTSLEAIQFGKFDSQPEASNSPHLPDEFPVYASLKSTVPVRKPDDWPQTLQPNQRIALFFDELLPRNFKGHLRLTMALIGQNQDVIDNNLSIEVLINGKRLYNSFLMCDKQLIELLIPENYFQSFGNIAQIRNNGKSALAFDAAEIGTFAHVGKSIYLGAENLDELPLAIRSIFNTGVISIEDDYDMKTINQKINRIRIAGATPLLSARKLDADKCQSLMKEFDNSVPIMEVSDTSAIETLKGLNSKIKLINSIPISDTTENRQLLGKLSHYSSDNEYWASWSSQGLERMGMGFQLHYLRQTGRELVDWLAGGGTAVYIKNIISGGRFFDSVFKTEYPSVVALCQVGKLFEGEPHKLPAQIYPRAVDVPLLYANATASVNASGVATVIIAKRFPTPEETEVLALLPWSGVTQITVEKGFFDKNSPFAGMASDLVSTSQNITIENNIFKYSGVFPELTVIRLVRKGAKPLIKQVSSEHYLPPVIKFNYNEITILPPDLPPKMTRHPIREANGFATKFGQSASFQIIPATPDESRVKFKPFEKQSILLNFMVSDKTGNYDSVYLTMQNGPPDVSYLSFNIYTRITSTDKRDSTSFIPLRFSFSGQRFQTQIPINHWQRIMVKLDENNKAPYWQSLRFLEPDRILNDKITNVSYEINDVVVLK